MSLLILPLFPFAAERRERVDELAVHHYAEVQMRPRGPARRAHERDRLSLHDRVAGADQKCTQMGVLRLDAVRVAQRQDVAVGLVVAAIEDGSIRDGQPVLSTLRGQINAGMELFRFGQRMHAHPIGICHRSVRILQRPDIFRRFRRRERHDLRLDVADVRLRQSLHGRNGFNILHGWLCRPDWSSRLCRKNAG